MALIFTVSILPDIDLLLSSFIIHRGPTHSLFFSFVIFTPFFVKYGKKTIPYFVALLSHLLIGDIYGPLVGIQLFWPFSADWITLATISNRNLLSIIFELTLFTISMIVMLLNKQFQKSFLHNSTKIYWLIPFASVLGPLLLGELSIRFSLPNLLIIPSLFYLVLFSLAMIGKNHKQDTNSKKY